MIEKAIDWERFGEGYAEYTRARFNGKRKYELYNSKVGEWQVVKKHSPLWKWVWIELLSEDRKWVTNKKEGAK